MDDGEDPGNVFAIPDLDRESQFSALNDSASSFLFSSIDFDDIDIRRNGYRPTILPNKDFFSIADISLDLIGDAVTPRTSTEPGPEWELPALDEPSEDFWLINGEKPAQTPNILSWKAFGDVNYEEPSTSYITEAGPQILDVVLQNKDDATHLGSQDHLVIETSFYAASLMALGLGRSSLLFAWNEDKQHFEQTVEAARLSGNTASSTDSLLSTFITCGNLTRKLRSYVEKVYINNKSAEQIAVANAVSSLLGVLQTHFNVSPSSLTSILQLQAAFKPAQTLLECFHRIILSIDTAVNDAVLLSSLYEFSQRFEHMSDSTNQILFEVLADASRPFLDFAGEWLGLQREAGLRLEKDGPGRSFVKTEIRDWVDEQGMEESTPDFVLDTSLMPSFMSEEDAQVLFDTGRSLRFIRTHHPEHPLAKPDVIASANPPCLDWNFSWQDVEGIQAKANQYEKDLIAAVKKYSSPDIATIETIPKLELPSGYELEFFGKSEAEIETQLFQSMDYLEQQISIPIQSSRLTDVLCHYLTADKTREQEQSVTFAPPISLVPSMSFGPIIAAQARVVNGTSICLFFKSHSLREHLSIQRRFHLLGDGIFSSRLSHALFDPELETAERQAGVAHTGGITGLRLGGRETWPPASSELRLALMGVLTESYSTSKSSANQTGSSLGRQSELPGDFSFAVRDMSDEEIQKCRDPNSIEALDFLRLSYKPPSPLEAVINPMILFKYDQLFKLLLRIVRMLYVVSQLFRDVTDRTTKWEKVGNTAQRFRIEAHHFVTCVSSYFFDVGIEATWRIFENKLDHIEARVNSAEGLSALGQCDGIDKLRQYHEHVLDRIMSTLLLRKRQGPVMRLLEEIFTLILRFAKYSRSKALDCPRDGASDRDIEEMYKRFRRKVEVFIAVCRELSEKKGVGEKEMSGSQGYPARGLFHSNELLEENTIVQLLAKLEMSGYYADRIDG